MAGVSDGGISSVPAELTPQGQTGSSWLCICMVAVLEASGWVAARKGGLHWPPDDRRAGWGCCLAEAQEEERGAVVICQSPPQAARS